MAYLNVREKRLEAKIAYVGPALSGKITNIDRLKTDVLNGRVTNICETLVDGIPLVSLDWVPLRMPSFNDCEVAVNVVAARGSISRTTLDHLFHESDGIVIVVDATPAAQPQNREVIAMVRDALSKAGASQAVVVQLNKSDLKGALSAVDLAATLEAEWPVVTAAAAEGKGVVETLETALSRVIDTMKARADDGVAIRADANPLLTALRQILRETVSEHMGTLERETMQRVNDALAEGRTDAALTERLDRMDTLMSELQSTLRRFSTTLDRAVIDVGTLAKSAKDTATRTVGIHAKQQDVPSKTDLSELEGRLLEAFSVHRSADREHASATTQALRHAIEAIATDQKKYELRERALRESVSEPISRIEGTIQSLLANTAATAARSDGQIAEIRDGLVELLDELKKRKKGWFS